MERLIERFRAMSRTEPLLAVREGAIGDFDLLARFHYRGGRPATVVKVLAVDDPVTGSVAGVLVVSMPTIDGAWREVAWGGRYGKGQTANSRWRIKRGALRGADGRGGGDASAWPGRSARTTALTSVRITVQTSVGTTARAEALARMNREVRTISRVVVHPGWRGMGVAVRLVRAYLERSLTVRTEAVASMGLYCPVFKAAGMREVRLPPRPEDARLADALEAVGARAWEIGRALAAHPAFVERELRRWARYGKTWRRLAAGAVEGLVSPAASALLGPRVAYVAERERGGRGGNRGNAEGEQGFGTGEGERR